MNVCACAVIAPPPGGAEQPEDGKDDLTAQDEHVERLHAGLVEGLTQVIAQMWQRVHQPAEGVGDQ
jgi:hypothetical protein